MKFFKFCILLVSLSVVVTSPYAKKIDWSKISPLNIDPPVPVNLPAIITEIKDTFEHRIVGGYEVKPNSLPYQVGLIINTGSGSAWCGGSLISDKYVLTAAHCAQPAQEAIILLGAHNIKDTNESTQIRIHVTKDNMIVHEGWSRYTLLNDIALIELPEPIKFNEYIQPVNLPTRKQQFENFVGKVVLASGWGKDSDKANSVSPVLRAVKNPVISKLRCMIRYFGVIRNGHICMGGSSKKSVCNGDSGGPLVIENNDGTKTLIGTTSFGIALGCEKGWPSVFTRTTYYLDWISENTGIEIK